ncbi:MAG: universal stress protein, partial [Desulfohalobiaceae bacterium]
RSRRLSMFRHILIPTDCTERTHNALKIALRLYELEKGQSGLERITLLHVIETISDDSGPEFEKFYSSLQKKAQKKMQALLQDYAQDAPLRQEILLGNRVQEILNFSQEQQVDLIVLNSHQIDYENPAQGWGTISHKVGILAPCPVMLVK